MTRTRRVAAAALSVLALSITAPISSADPAFGPGNKGGGEGNSGPHVGKCHPPGQTSDTPGCK